MSIAIPLPLGGAESATRERLPWFDSGAMGDGSIGWTVVGTLANIVTKPGESRAFAERYQVNAAGSIPCRESGWGPERLTTATPRVTSPEG